MPQPGPPSAPLHSSAAGPVSDRPFVTHTHTHHATHLRTGAVVSGQWILGVLAVAKHQAQAGPCPCKILLKPLQEQEQDALQQRRYSHVQAAELDY